MAGQQIEIAASRFEKGDKGMLALSLTHYDDDAEPAISAGSVLEIAGALFQFTADESITGWGTIGNNQDVYVKCVVAGTAVTAEFTTSAPTWDADKAGWYGSGGAALHRYVAKLRKDGSGNYTDKGLLQGGPEVRNAAIGSDAVRTPQIQDAAVTGPKLAMMTTAGNSGVISAGGTWTVPAGVYTIVADIPSGLYVQVYDGSTWRGQGGATLSFLGAAVVSDGTNVRVGNASASDRTVYYRKLA